MIKPDSQLAKENQYFQKKQKNLWHVYVPYTSGNVCEEFVIKWKKKEWSETVRLTEFSLVVNFLQEGKKGIYAHKTEIVVQQVLVLWGYDFSEFLILKLYAEEVERGKKWGMREKDRCPNMVSKGRKSKAKDVVCMKINQTLLLESFAFIFNFSFSRYYFSLYNKSQLFHLKESPSTFLLLFLLSFPILFHSSLIQPISYKATLLILIMFFNYYYYFQNNIYI